MLLDTSPELQRERRKARDAEDPAVMTSKARAAAFRRFEAMVDPDGKLPPDERLEKAKAARRIWLLGVAQLAKKRKEQAAA